VNGLLVDDCQDQTGLLVAIEHGRASLTQVILDARLIARR
jgi:hypothetical protein